jgi:hypothetical protein
MHGGDPDPGSVRIWRMLWIRSALREEVDPHTTRERQTCPNLSIPSPCLEGTAGVKPRVEIAAGGLGLRPAVRSQAKIRERRSDDDLVAMSRDD